MTNEQAINELKDWQTAFSRMDKDMSYAIEAFDMAIEALESQERQELIVGSYLLEEPSCSDKQISMAIGAIIHMLNIGYYSEDMEDALNSAIRVLAEVK